MPRSNRKANCVVRANPIDRAQWAQDKWATIIDDFAGLMQPPSNRNFSQEPIMNAEITAKFTAFAAAFTMNCLIFSGVAYMFDVPMKQRTGEIADSGQRR